MRAVGYGEVARMELAKLNYVDNKNAKFAEYNKQQAGGASEPFYAKFLRTHPVDSVRIADLKKDNVEVVGVSFDSAESHQKFISKYNLNFPLLADTDGAIADAYGVRMAGKNMSNRASFLIGLDGKIVHVTNTMNADTHLSEMKEAVGSLKK